MMLFSIFPSCENFLDLEPESDLTLPTFWQTADDANYGIIAIYSCLSRATSSGIWNWGEVRADNYNYYFKNAPDQQELIENAIQIDNPAANWTTLYETIYKANAAIKYIPGIVMNQSLKKDYMAEAYALRALCYFYCVRIWGDVPLFLEPVESVNDGIYRKRVSKDYVLQHVILSDLEKAYAGMDPSREEIDTKRSRINIATVCAMLMDVYAWMHDYEMVVKIFEERVALLNLKNWRTLTADGGASFDPKWREMFWETTGTNRSPEVWFRIAYDRYGNGQNSATGYFLSGSSKLEISSRLRSVYRSVDKRPNLQWIKDGSGSKYRLRKKFWTDEQIQTYNAGNAIDSDVDLIMYRYADVVLLYAEALNDIDRTEDAVSWLNRTRVRAGNMGYTTDQFIDKEALLDAIIDERQKEFVAEGKRWFDLVRTNRWTRFTTLTDPDPQKALFPIHRDHLNQNPNLTQNYPAYPYP